MKFIDKVKLYIKRDGIWFVIGAGILYSPFIVGIFKSSMRVFGMWWLAVWANPLTPAIPMCILFGYIAKRVYKWIQRSDNDKVRNDLMTELKEDELNDKRV